MIYEIVYPCIGFAFLGLGAVAFGACYYFVKMADNESKEGSVSRLSFFLDRFRDGDDD